MTIGVGTFRMGLNLIVLTKCDMDQTALIGTHGRKVNRAALAQCTRSSRMGHGDDFVTAAALISLNIDSHGITEAELTAHQKGEHRLQRFKGATMTTNQNSKIRRGYIKDKLALVTLILIDRGIGGVKETQQGAKDRDGNIGYRIEFFVRELFTSFIVSSDLRILAGINLGLLFKFFRHGTLHLLGT